MGQEILRIRSGDQEFLWEQAVDYSKLGDSITFEIENATPDALYRIQLYLSPSFCFLDVMNYSPFSKGKETIVNSWKKLPQFRGNFPSYALLSMQKWRLARCESIHPENYLWKKKYRFAISGGNLTPGKSLLGNTNVTWPGEFSRIGSGSYSEVKKYSGAAVKIGEPFCVYGISSALFKEMCFLHHLNHPNIIKITDFVVGDAFDYACITMPLGGPDLFTLMKQGGLTKGLEWKYFKQIVSALLYLHSHGILHGDLKPQNFILMNGEIQLADFGISDWPLIEIEKCSKFFSEWYRSPELWKGQPYTPASDVWALGCILAEMLDPMHYPLFQKETDIAKVLSPYGEGFLFRPEKSHEILLRRFLNLDPAAREPLNILARDPLLNVEIPPQLTWIELSKNEFPHRLTGVEHVNETDAVLMRKILRFLQSKFSDRIVAVGYALHELNCDRQNNCSLAAAVFVSALMGYNSSDKVLQLRSVTNGLGDPSEIDRFIHSHLQISDFSFLHWTAYDILEMLAKDGGVRGNKAKTLLQCTYFTHLSRAYRPGEIAHFCWEIVEPKSVATPILRQAMIDWKFLWWNGSGFKLFPELNMCDRGISALNLLQELHSLL